MGRVLSEEEISEREQGATSYLGSLPDGWHDTQSERVLDLIATIHDRDKTIAELRLHVTPITTFTMIQDKIERLERQSTVMLDALDDARNMLAANRATYELFAQVGITREETGVRIDQTSRCIDKINNAIAKVKDDATEVR